MRKSFNRPKLDLTGQKFYMLTVLGLSEKRVRNAITWKCKCDCGNITYVNTNQLTSGHCKSCGCWNTVHPANLRHGMYGTQLYRAWKSIKDRCYREKCKEYKYYGAKGVTMCDEWLHDFQKFADWSIVHGFEEGLSIDRIDVNGNYEPSNCRWITMQQQMRNRTDTHYITYKGQTHCMRDWADILGISYHTLASRILCSKWSIEKSFTTPIKAKKGVHGVIYPNKIS